MKIINVKTSDLKPYEKNAKLHNQSQINNVATSIKKYGFVQPIVIDKNNVVIIGHCRLEASKLLNLKEVPCVKADTLTKQQVEELRLLDNKLNESDWDFEMLEDILSECDLSDFPELVWGGVELDNEIQESKNEENPYTMKVDVPQYEMKGECPKLDELVDLTKMKELEEEINKSQIPQEQKDFLILASKRHLIFDYSKIAEYYANQNKEVQELMEKSALVIIDFNDAIKNGFVEIRKEINEILNEGEIDEE